MSIVWFTASSRGFPCVVQALRSRTHERVHHDGWGGKLLLSPAEKSPAALRRLRAISLCAVRLRNGRTPLLSGVSGSGPHKRQNQKPTEHTHASRQHRAGTRGHPDPVLLSYNYHRAPGAVHCDTALEFTHEPRASHQDAFRDSHRTGLTSNLRVDRWCMVHFCEINPHG